jgi:hypothetical protein
LRWSTRANIVWCCFPRFDGDPVFCAVLDTAPLPQGRGVWAIELVDGVESSQSYLDNTAVLVTRLTDRSGGVIEITDCAPRFQQHARLHQPMSLLRRVRRLAGSPRIVTRLHPAFQWGRGQPQGTTGSHHVRFVGEDMTLRLTTDASITAVLEERPIFVEDAVTFLLGADESIPEHLPELGRHFVEQTLEHWRECDERLTHRGDVGLFERLEPLGERAIAMHDQADAGLWELRGSTRVHTFSSVMCWAACDRLARIAERLGLAERARRWRGEADRIRAFVEANCWSHDRNTFVSAAGGNALDASLLLLAELNFLPADDPRYIATVTAIERNLKRGDFVFRYVEHDDFGAPSNAFLVCTFWLVDALASVGRRDEARALFNRLFACRNRHGLLAEHVHPATGELWGNFVQTYSMVGLINSAIRLSVSWDDAF